MSSSTAHYAPSHIIIRQTTSSPSTYKEILGSSTVSDAELKETGIHSRKHSLIHSTLISSPII